eukprot:5458675-Prymnesium_polylepis.1
MAQVVEGTEHGLGESGRSAAASVRSSGALTDTMSSLGGEEGPHATPTELKPLSHDAANAASNKPRRVKKGKAAGKASSTLSVKAKKDRFGSSAPQMPADAAERVEGGEIGALLGSSTVRERALPGGRGGGAARGLWWSEAWTRRGVSPHPLERRSRPVASAAWELPRDITSSSRSAANMHTHVHMYMFVVMFVVVHVRHGSRTCSGSSWARRPNHDASETGKPVGHRRATQTTWVWTDPANFSCRRVPLGRASPQ